MDGDRRIIDKFGYTGGFILGGKFFRTMLEARLHLGECGFDKREAYQYLKLLPESAEKVPSVA